MDAKEICKIIKACRDNGVSKLNIENLVVEFASYDPLDQIYTAAPNQPGSRAPVRAKAEQETIATQGREQDLFSEEEQYEDELLITDPVAWENRLGAGEFDDSLPKSALRRAEEETA